MHELSLSERVLWGIASPIIWPGNGWKEIVLIDKGPLPNPGGSTGHASNFIFPIDHSKVMTQITQDSMRQYKELGLFRQSGGLELARTEGQSAGTEAAGRFGQVLGGARGSRYPEQVKKLMPFINTKLILGAFWIPTVGVVDSLRAGTIMRETAQQMGALTVFSNTEVHKLGVHAGGSGRSPLLEAKSRVSTLSSPAVSGARDSRGWRGHRSL